MLRFSLGLIPLVVLHFWIAGMAYGSDLIERRVLMRKDLAGQPGTEIIVTQIRLAPGATVPRHTHPGDEVLYVLSGGIVQAPGKPPVKFKEGQTAHFPRGTVHGGFEVKGTQTLVGITTHIVDKGQPMTVPAKE